MTHLVIYGLAGQTLRHVMPRRVASATYEITDLRKAQDDPDRVLASGVSSPPAWLLTLDDDAGPSQPDGTKIPVTLTAGPALDEAVVVTASDGRFEGFTVKAIETDDYLGSSSILAGTYAPGSTVESVTLEAAVPIDLYDFEEALDDQRPLRVEWRYGLAVVTEPITLTRQNLATASTGPAIELVRERYPNMAGNLNEGAGLEGLAAYSLARVRLDLISRREDPASFMLGHQGHMLLVARMILDAAIGGFAPGMRELTDFVSGAETDYSTQLEAIVIGTPGGEAIKLSTEATASERPDTTYRSPIGAM